MIHRIGILTLVVTSAVASQGAPGGARELPKGPSLAGFHWLDPDRDGDRDALAIDAAGGVRMFENRGNGAFVDATASVGLADVRGVARVSSFAHDGGDVLLLATVAGSRVLVHERGCFVDRAEELGLGRLGPVDELRRVDVDGDGRLDLHLAGAWGHRLFLRRDDGYREMELGAGPGATLAATGGPFGASPAAMAPGLAGPGPGAGGSGSALTASSGFGTSVAPSPAGPAGGATAPTPLCAGGVEDQVGTGCIAASSLPTFGMLYPLGDELFIQAGSGFVGVGTTTPGYALEVAGRLVSGVGNAASGAGSAVGGGASNTASGDDATVAGGTSNLASSTASTVGGGTSNLSVGSQSTVLGGLGGSAAYRSVVAGGEANAASFNFSAVLGGAGNVASQTYAAVGGGASNHASGSTATVLGGGDAAFPANGNVASGVAATVAGGRANEAAGDFSLAAGQRAKALHAGSFVWADSQPSDLATTAPDQFLVRAASGMGVGRVPDPSFQLDVEGDVAASDTVVSTKVVGAPFSVGSTDVVTNLNADLLDGLHATAFSSFGSVVDEAELAAESVTTAKLADGAVTSAKVASGAVTSTAVAADAAIAGTKVAPDFGSQDVVTLGRLGAGTSAPGLPVELAGGTAASPAGGGFLQVGPAAQNVVVDRGEVLARASGAPATLRLNPEGGDVLLAADPSSEVGIGTTLGSSKLNVFGEIESTSGGLVFPDGSVQTTAAIGGGVPSGALVTTPFAGAPVGFTATDWTLRTTGGAVGTTLRAPLPAAVHSHASVWLDGRLYVIGGSGSDAVRALDLTTATWTALAPLSAPRADLRAAVIDGKIYACGGEESGGLVATLEEYDPDTDTWTTKSPMSVARRAHGLAVMGGRLYAVGGIDGSGTYLSSTERYDPGTDSWTNRASMPSGPRAQFGCVAVSDFNLWVIGGRDSSTPAFDTMVRYNPGSNFWTPPQPALSVPRRNVSAAVAEDRVWIFGGLDAAGDVLDSVDTLHLDLVATDPPPAMGVGPRHLLSAVAGDGSVFVTGGVDATGTSHSEDVQEYGTGARVQYVHRKD